MRRRARLIYRVTGSLRTEMAAALGRTISRMEAAAAALDGLIEQGSADRSVTDRRNRALKSRDSAAARLAQLQGLRDGQEFAEGFVEVVSEVRTGDSAERLRDAQIVIVDGVIAEIRNP